MNEQLPHAQELNRKVMVKELLRAINRLPDNDHPNSIKQLIAFLNEMLRMKSLVPPTTEIMIIIKHLKPKLYHATKLSITSTSNLNLLFQLEMDVELAIDRLQKMIEG